MAYNIDHTSWKLVLKNLKKAGSTNEEIIKSLLKSLGRYQQEINELREKLWLTTKDIITEDGE